MPLLDSKLLLKQGRILVTTPCEYISTVGVSPPLSLSRVELGPWMAKTL